MSWYLVVLVLSIQVPCKKNYYNVHFVCLNSLGLNSLVYISKPCSNKALLITLVRYTYEDKKMYFGQPDIQILNGFKIVF